MTTPQPAIARMLALFLCSAVLLSTLAGMGLALFAADRPAWFPFAFEGVAALAAVIGCLVATGRMGGAAPLALACVAGAIGVAAIIAYYTARTSFTGVDLRVWALVRFLGAAGICCTSVTIAIWPTLGRSLPRLAMGGLAGLLAIGLLGALWFGRVQLGTMHELVRIIIGGVAFVAIIALVSASVHLLIGAFESAGETREQAA